MQVQSGGRRKGDASGLERLRRDCEELRASLESMQTYYEDLLGSLQDAIIVVDPGGRVRSVNQAAEELTGLSAQPLSGRPFEQLGRAPQARQGISNLVGHPCGHCAEGCQAIGAGQSLLKLSDPRLFS